MFQFFNKKVVPNVSVLGVDMHSHLLPGIDDGLQTVEQSVEFIKQLQALGYKKLICTPHILHGVHNNTPATILPALESVKKALAEANIQMPIEAAAEYMVDEELEQLIKSNEQLLTFGKNFMLIEMSYAGASPNIYQVIFDLRMKNIKPILAHPERYNYYHQNFRLYVDLRDRDVFFQVNLLSLTGYYGKAVKQTAEKLIEKNMVEFLGTDMHHAAHLKATQDFMATQSFANLIKNYPFLNRNLL